MLLGTLNLFAGDVVLLADGIDLRLFDSSSRALFRSGDFCKYLFSMFADALFRPRKTV